MSAARGEKAERKKEEAPQQALQRLERALAANELASAYVFRGEERYFRDRMSDLVLRHAGERGLEICRHDAKSPEFSLAGLTDDLRGNALFSSARCVLVRQIGSLVVTKSPDHSPALVELLLARIARPDGGTLVLGAESLSSDHVLVKAVVAAGGWVVQCRRLWDTPPPWGSGDPTRIELVGWFLERARSLGVSLRPDEAAHVVHATGNDLSALEGEIERLRERGSRSVAEVVGWQAGASPWVIAEDMVRGDARAAAEGLEALFRGGFQARDGARTLDAGGLVAMLLNALYGKVREALAAASEIERGATEKDAASFAGVSGAPRAQEAFRSRMASRPAGEWRTMLEEIATLERRSHSSVPLDGNDFQLLSLRWRNRARR
jgi:DNA polymerase III delta subunit